LYDFFGWPTKPNSSVSINRFNKITEFAIKLFEEETLTKILEKKKVVKVLDVMAASGIAGVAFAKAIVSKGRKADLLITDARESELDLVKEWMQIAGLDEDSVILKTSRSDVTRLPYYFDKTRFDLIICWGSSLSHLDVYELILFLSGAKEIQPEDGALIIQQADLLPKILINNDFQRILIEGELLTIFKDYDVYRGVQKRLIYKIPQLEYMGIRESRLWEISQVAAIAWIFYKKIKIYEYSEISGRNTKVIVAYQPRKNTPNWMELTKTLTNDIQESVHK
jgi:hypothetical protein